MASEREQRNSSRKLAPIISLVMLLSSCTVGRVYVGTEIMENPDTRIVIGSTTKSDILGIYGPPGRVQRQYDGDLFIYSYFRKNSSSLNIEEPVVTDLTIFTYTRVQQKKDSLVILFDKDGVVKNYGFYRETEELTPY